MLNFIKKYNIGYKLAAVFAAVLLWIYVMGVQNPELEVEISRIQVGYVGENAMLEERGLVLISGKDSTVSLTLRGNRNSLVRLKRENISIEVNLDSITAPGSVNMHYTVLLPESGITIIDRSPSYITVKADKVVTKNVPVRIVTEGKPEEGYIIGTATANPSSINVTGPSDQLKDITAAQVVVDVSGDKNTLTRDLKYTLVNAEGMTQTSTLVTSDNTLINIVQKINIVKALQLQVSVVEGGYALTENAKITIAPESLMLEGAPDLLATKDSINIGEINLAEVEDTADYEFDINLPEGVKLTEGTPQAHVKVELVDMAVKTIYAVQVKTIGQELPENMHVSLPVKVELKGSSRVVGAILQKDVWLEVNLGGIKPAPGVYTFPANIVIEGYDKGVAAIGEYEVIITVEDFKK